MITGHGDMNLAIRSLKHDATDFITKPINVEALEIALRRAREKITMRRRLQDYTRSLEQLVREKTELQDHLASLGLMIGSISHGMKGLLTSLDGGFTWFRRV
jgi:FixJ family two-component response regulator